MWQIFVGSVDAVRFDAFAKTCWCPTKQKEHVNVNVNMFQVFPLIGPSHIYTIRLLYLHWVMNVYLQWIVRKQCIGMCFASWMEPVNPWRVDWAPFSYLSYLENVSFKSFLKPAMCSLNVFHNSCCSSLQSQVRVLMWRKLIRMSALLIGLQTLRDESPRLQLAHNVQTAVLFLWLGNWAKEEHLSSVIG